MRSIQMMLAACCATLTCYAAAPMSRAQSAPAATRPSTQPRTAQDAVTPRQPDLRRHAEFMYRNTQGPVGLLFLGDSICDAWPRKGEWSWLKFAPYQPADFGINSEKTEQTLWRIVNGELDGIRPKVVVVLIGTNNVGNPPLDTPEFAAAGVKKVVETIREKLPESKVLLLAIFPRDVKGSIRRDAALAINPIIAKLDDGKMIRFLDIGRIFLGPDDEILLDVMPDKLHPNAKGYDLWYEAMRPLLEEMMK